MSKAPVKSAPRDRRIGIIFLTLFLDLVGFSIIFPLFPAMLDYYLPDGDGGGSLLGSFVGWLVSIAESTGAENPRFMTSVLFGGLLGSLYSVLAFVAAPLWGALSDRIGRRPVLLLTVGGIAVSYLLWCFAAPFWLLIVSRILSGVMGGNLSVATAAVADITSRENRTKGLALVGIAFGLGFIIGPAVGGLSALIDLTQVFPSLAAIGVNPFTLPALISLCLAVLNWFWLYKQFDETLPKADPNRVVVKDKRSPLFHVFHLFAVEDRRVRRTNLVYLIFMAAFSGMEFTLTFLAVERLGFSTAQNGLMFVFIGLVLVIVQGGIVRRLSGPVGEKRLALGGMGLGVAAFLILSGAGSMGVFFLALGFMAAAIALASPTLSSLVSLYSPEDQQGRCLGVFRSAGSLARAIGPIATAVLFFRFGSAFAYTLGGLLLILPLILMLPLPQPKK